MSDGRHQVPFQGMGYGPDKWKALDVFCPQALNRICAPLFKRKS